MVLSFMSPIICYRPFLSRQRWAARSAMTHVSALATILAILAGLILCIPTCLCKHAVL